MTRTDQGSSTTGRAARRPFVAAEIHLSRDGRHVLHFLAGGAIVRRPVSAYRDLLGAGGVDAVKVAHTSSGLGLARIHRAFTYLPATLRLLLLVLAVLRPLLGPRAGSLDALRDLVEHFVQLIANGEPQG